MIDLSLENRKIQIISLFISKMRVKQTDAETEFPVKYPFHSNHSNRL